MKCFFLTRPPGGPLGSLQVVVGLLQLPDVFVQLILDAAGLAEVVLQHRDLLVALRVLLLHFVLNTRGQRRRTTLVGSLKPLKIKLLFAIKYETRPVAYESH